MTFFTKNLLDFIEPKTCNLNIGHRLKVTSRLTRRPGLQFVSALELFIVCILMVGRPVVLAQQPGELLTNAVDVISLPAEKASDSIKVSVTGVVTASDPALMESDAFSAGREMTS